jgi:hypothetical protein
MLVRMKALAGHMVVKKSFQSAIRLIVHFDRPCTQPATVYRPNWV